MEIHSHLPTTVIIAEFAICSQFHTFVSRCSSRYYDSPTHAGFLMILRFDPLLETLKQSEAKSEDIVD